MPNDVLVEDPQLIQGMDLKVESDEYDGESLDDQPLIVMDPDHVSKIVCVCVCHV